MERMLAHRPVLLQEAIKALSPNAGEVVIDATVGNAGHSLEFLRAIGKEGFLLGIDCDDEALRLADETLRGEMGARYLLLKGRFSNIDELARKAGVERADIVFFDLGVSSMQLDLPERGFSFMHDGFLDMRMDRSAYMSAYDLVNSLSEAELAELIRRYGEERFARRIARSIVEWRKKRNIATTKELADIVSRAVPTREKGQHPATRTFQAIRIAVNNELEELSTGLEKAFNLLKPGGRIGVISFHSLEDRIVKRRFLSWKNMGKGGILNKKPLLPSCEEVAVNKRARSAKLRVFVKGGKA